MLDKHIAVLFLASAAILEAGCEPAQPIAGTASQACYMHYLGSTDSDAFYRVPVPVREHVLDCIELFDKLGHLPSDASVAALSKRYDAAEAADSLAYEKKLARKLGHSPTDADYTVELAQSMCAYSTDNRTRCAQAVTGAALGTQNAQRIQEAVQEAHEGLLNLMKDPNSTEFDSQDGAGYSFESNGSLYSVCGAVNAKNGFGGYTGMQTWVYVIPKNMIYTQETGVTKAMILRDCTGKVRPKKVAKQG